jgi:hypothetical protein
MTVAQPVRSWGVPYPQFDVELLPAGHWEGPREANPTTSQIASRTINRAARPIHTARVGFRDCRFLGMCVDMPGALPGRISPNPSASHLQLWFPSSGHKHGTPRRSPLEDAGNRRRRSWQPLHPVATTYSSAFGARQPLPRMGGPMLGRPMEAVQRDHHLTGLRPGVAHVEHEVVVRQAWRPGFTRLSGGSPG